MTDDDELTFAEYERRHARNAAVDARVRSALLAAVLGDDATYATRIKYLLNDAGTAGLVELLISFTRTYTTDLIAAQGTQLTQRRLEQDISHCQELILEEEQR